jgi:hypothetical protein
MQFEKVLHPGWAYPNPIPPKPESTEFHCINTTHTVSEKYKPNNNF